MSDVHEAQLRFALNLDKPRWQEMARERGIRLPAWSARCTAARMERWLRRLGIPAKMFYEWGHFRSFVDFIKLNPQWPLYAFVGLMLEYKCQLEELDAN